jgi:hypothetical protein
MAATTMKTKPEKKGRSYGRTTAWFALRSGVMRVRLGCVGSVNVEPHGNEMTMSVQPYSGGDARWVPRRMLSKHKDRAQWMQKMPIPLMEYAEYPECDGWIRA